MRKYGFTPILTLAALLLLLAVTAACYRGGRMEVRSVPPEAYVYLNGSPVGPGTASGDNNIIVDNLTPGEYKVGIYNYGFKPEERTITVQDGKTTHIDLNMVREVGPISGPFGRIIMEGPSNAAVLMNGTTPAYLVGHVDEFDKDLGAWRGQLLVPPGTHQITVMDRSNTVWSGSVTVAANQTVNIDLHHGGTQSTSNWPEGEKLSNLPPIKASVFKTTVAVAPVMAQFSSNPGQVDCGGSAQLTWSSSNAVADQISEVGDVPTSGQREVQPKQTTTYKLVASGPGGTVTQMATVNVNPAIQASISVSPVDVRYHKVGDQVEQQPTAQLQWSATNASSVSVNPIGSVGTTGSQAIPVTPSATQPGPVDETKTFTLTASNACGGQVTQTATLHIVGSIENINEAVNNFDVNSIYFPTALPSTANPQGGLVPEEQEELNKLITFIKQFYQGRTDTPLLLEGHADVRGSNKYNDALSKRRTDRVQSYLVDHDVHAKIDAQDYGKREQITMNQVLHMIDQNTSLTPHDRERLRRRIRECWLANNRRVDIKLGATGLESHRAFPYDSQDAKELASEKRPGEVKHSNKLGAQASKN